MSSCGTYSGYVCGCRCDRCKRANAQYQRKYRSIAENRAIAVRHSKRRNHAAMLALRYLRDHDRKTYYRLMDQATQWLESADRR